MNNYQYPLNSIIIGRVSPHNASVRHQLEEKMQMTRSTDKGYPLKSLLREHCLALTSKRKSQGLGLETELGVNATELQV